MSRAPLVFLGSPPVAADVLRALVAAGHEVVLVVTAPDKRRGRGSALVPTAVKSVAIEIGIPVVHDLGSVAASAPPGTVGVVVAYGRIIPRALLGAIPMLNVHFSLLPRWRGAAPVERAILAGDTSTGVCIMRMDEGLDTGNVISHEVVAIGDTDSTETLTAELGRRGTTLLLAALEAGRLEGSPQSGVPVYAHKVAPGEGLVDWRDPCESILRKVRALRAWTRIDGSRISLVACTRIGPGETCEADETPGSVGADASVRTGDGAVRLVEVRPEGRPTMAADAWLRGWRGKVSFDAP